MSHGPGVSQRRILDYLEAHPWGELTAICWECDRTHYLSTLRAAHRLAALGKVELRYEGPTRTLVICRPGISEAYLEAQQQKDEADAAAMQRLVQDWTQQLRREAVRRHLHGLLAALREFEPTSEAQGHEVTAVVDACLPLVKSLSVSNNSPR